MMARRVCYTCSKDFAPNDRVSFQKHELKCAGTDGSQTRDSSSGRRNQRLLHRADDVKNYSANEPPDDVEIDICPDQQGGAPQTIVDGMRCVLFADGTGYTINIRNERKSKIAVLISIDGRNVTLGVGPMIIREKSTRIFKGFIVRRATKPLPNSRVTIESEIEGFVARKPTITADGPLNRSLGEILITFTTVRFIQNNTKIHEPKTWSQYPPAQGRARPNVLVTQGGPLSTRKNELATGGRFISTQKKIRVCGWTIMDSASLHF